MMALAVILGVLGSWGAELSLVRNASGGWVFGDGRLAVTLDAESGLPVAYRADDRVMLERDPDAGCPLALDCQGPVGAKAAKNSCIAEKVWCSGKDEICAQIANGDWRYRLHVQLLAEKRMVRHWLEFAWMGPDRKEFNGVWFLYGKAVCPEKKGEYFCPTVFPPVRHKRPGFRRDHFEWGHGNATAAVADDGEGRSYLACIADMEPYSDPGNVCVIERDNGFSLAMRFLSRGVARPGVWQTVGDGWLRFGRETAERELETMHDWHRTVGYLPPSDRPDRVYDLAVYSTHPKGRAESGAGDVGGFGYATTYLPYIAALGLNCIWVRPVTHLSCYHPDRIYEQMEGIGTEADHLAFVRRAHDLGMEVWSDAVPHGGAVTNQRTKVHPEWVCRKRDGDFQDRYWAYDFNWPTWVKYYSDWVEWYTRKFELDGWRMDVPTGSRFPNWNPDIPYARASYSIRQGGISQQTAIRAAARRANPNAVTMGEENPSCWSKVADTIYDQYLCHSHFHAFREREAKDVVPDLRRWLHEQRLAYIPGSLWMRYPESHDSRLACALWGRPCANALMALCAWIEGFPLVCNEGEDGAFEAWRRILATRKALPELRRGEVDYVSATAPDGVFVCTRKLDGLESAVIINFNPDRVKGEVVASGTKVAIDLPPFGYEVRRLKGADVPSVLGDLKPFIPEKKGPGLLECVHGGVRLCGGAVAELRDLTNGVVRADYALSVDRTETGLGVRVSDFSGLDPKSVRLVVRFAGTERWFAHAAEGSFESPFFVRHPGVRNKVRCSGMANGGRFVDQEVCWSNYGHPFGFDRNNAEVGSAVGISAVAVGGFAEGVLVELRDRLGDEEGLALTLSGTSASDFRCEVREISAERAFACREASTGDGRLHPVSGGWLYKDGALKVRFTNSGAIVGAWRKDAAGRWRAELGRCGWRGTKSTDHVPTLGWRLHDENVSEQDYDCYGKTVFRRGTDGSLSLEFSEVLPALFGRRYLSPPMVEAVTYTFRNGGMEAHTSFDIVHGGWGKTCGIWEYRIVTPSGSSFEGSRVRPMGLGPHHTESKSGIHRWIYHDATSGDLNADGGRLRSLIWTF